MVSDEEIKQEQLKKNIKNLLNDWKTWAVLILSLCILLGRPYLGSIINTDPLYCDHYLDIWNAKDEYIRSCRLTCARDYNCSVAWQNNTYFNYTTDICYCGNSGFINYHCYRINMTGYDIYLNNTCTHTPSVVTW